MVSSFLRKSSSNFLSFLHSFVSIIDTQTFPPFVMRKELLQNILSILCMVLRFYRKLVICKGRDFSISVLDEVFHESLSKSYCLNFL